MASHAPTSLLFGRCYSEVGTVQPANGALRTIHAASHNRKAIGVGVKYSFGTHFDTDGAGLAPTSVNQNWIGSSLRFLGCFFFHFAHNCSLFRFRHYFRAGAECLPLPLCGAAPLHSSFLFSRLLGDFNCHLFRRTLFDQFGLCPGGSLFCPGHGYFLLHAIGDQAGHL